MQLAINNYGDVKSTQKIDSLPLKRTSQIQRNSTYHIAPSIIMRAIAALSSLHTAVWCRSVRCEVCALQHAQCSARSRVRASADNPCTLCISRDITRVAIQPRTHAPKAAHAYVYDAQPQLSRCHAVAFVLMSY